MKIIKGIFFTLLALSLIICTGIFIFFQTFDTDQYLPQITKKVSVALGRSVSIGHVGLGLSSRGITLDAGPLTVADDTAFTTEPFINVDRARISLNLRSLILQRKTQITDILLQSPQIHFIRSQEGNINVLSIGQTSRPAESNHVVASAAKQSFKNKIISPPSALLEVMPYNDVIKITIQDASISFIDQNQALPLDIWLNGINARLNDFSLVKPFQLLLDASLYSNVPNVHADALVSLDQSKRSIHINGLSLQTDLSHLDSNGLNDISPGLSNSSILKSITGVMQLNLAHLDIDTYGHLTADGDISIIGGVIKNFNIIQTLLSKIGAFGSMQSSIDNFFKGQLKDKLGAEDTIIKQAQAKFSFHDKTIFIDDSTIQTDILELTAKGSIDQGLNLNMQTILHLNDDVSAALVDEIGGLKYLMDDSKRIVIDGNLKGVIPRLKYKPNKDFKKRSKKMWMEEGGNILGALLGGGQK